MVRNYFKIAWRNLIKNRSLSFINISGLALGMAVVILIGLWIYDEITFDQNHENYDRIAHVLMHKTANGNKRTRMTMPFPLGNELRDKYGDSFDYVVMSSFHGDNILSVDNKSLSKYGGFMEPDALRMLSLKMVYGDWDGLKTPNSVVISRSTAKAFFGDVNPVGKSIKISNLLNVFVTGVYQDIPFNARFNDLEFIAPWELYVTSYDWVRYARDNNLWDNNSYQLFVQIADDTTMKSVNTKIKDAVYDNLPDYSKRNHPELVLHPMKDWHLRSNWKNGANIGGFIQYVWLFGIVGLFVLLLACINFMNLSTAQSEKRAKEVGVLKSIGSSKRQLINQFLSESFLVVVLAFMLAVSLVFLVIPAFNQLADKQIIFPYKNMSFWIMNMGFILVTSIIAGSYPAFYLSSFRPVKVLKGTFKAGKTATSFRKTLVVIQFTVSVILVIGTIVVKKQIEYSKNRPIGYEKNRLVMIEKVTEDYEGKYNFLRSELLNTRAIIEMSESSSPLTDVWSSGGGFEWEGKDPNFLTNIVTVCVSHDYGNTVGWNLVKGRDFSRAFSTDSTAFVLNEAAVKYMGIKDPIGKTIRWNNQEHQVIGVVKDILVESPFESVKQAVYMIKYDNTNWIELKLNPNKSANESLVAIKTIFRKHIPNVPFEYQFVDDAFSKKFVAEERIRKLSTIFTFFAIFISCLGLFGLASFLIEQRTKEIGIRKVVGASVFNLWQLLSKDFLKLVILAIIIAIPIAYYGVVNWLNNYEYRTEVSWWVFAITGIGALTITILTVSLQAIKAANTNPIKSLKTE
ncbi:ABC transporter permease [Flavivirga spongiicola]|uniref:ABC transporter permease n=1 Tax=Flavivirga spongiicola TaxID=421621 RepID=A0ABU7XY96_9FLAO|nr:ABC transporter permease [Flavivirga sp. MEBiC05379]MDO5980770.1 ABC transporter permease [Flavivirga sp. MEBiC05379]